MILYLFFFYIVMDRDILGGDNNAISRKSHLNHVTDLSITAPQFRFLKNGLINLGRNFASNSNLLRTLAFFQFLLFIKFIYVYPNEIYKIFIKLFILKILLIGDF